MLHETWRRGAVLVGILEAHPHGVVFVERARHLRRHPGEIAFPGGTEEPDDAGDPVRTALRELLEELSVAAGHVKIVGQLPELEQPRNRFLITPVVGVLDAETKFAIDGNEIAGVFTVPLGEIVAPGAISEDAAISRARGKPMFAFDYAGRHIWGLTGRVLKSFVDAWRSGAFPMLAE